jgi:cyclopropane fatty-acyl-phospholipid synthase-like methyltransferase
MPDWNELFQDSQNVLETPEPLALELARVLRPHARVLDLGCGGGRHLTALAQAGHRTTGLDVAPKGLEICRERLADQSLRADLVLGDFRAPLPFPDATFDAVLSVKVVNHATPEEISRVFGEVTRITRPGGRFTGTAISTLDARYGDGREVAEHTFVHDRPPETGVIHHYFTEAALRRLLVGWSLVDLALTERVVSPDEPIFGRYLFRAGVAPVLCHWNFQALK